MQFLKSEQQKPDRRLLREQGTAHLPLLSFPLLFLRSDRAGGGQPHLPFPPVPAPSFGQLPEERGWSWEPTLQAPFTCHFYSPAACSWSTWSSCLRLHQSMDTWESETFSTYFSNKWSDKHTRIKNLKLVPGIMLGTAMLGNLCAQRGLRMVHLLLCLGNEQTEYQGS